MYEDVMELKAKMEKEKKWGNWQGIPWCFIHNYSFTVVCPVCFVGVDKLVDRIWREVNSEVFKDLPRLIEMDSRQLMELKFEVVHRALVRINNVIMYLKETRK